MVIKDLCQEKDVRQNIQCVKDFLEQLKMNSFIQRIGNIQHLMILLMNWKKYINWFKNKRIKKRLGYLSQKQFMLNYNQY